MIPYTIRETGGARDLTRPTPEAWMSVVFLFGRVGLVVFSFVVHQLLKTPNNNGTQIDHKWDQAGPGKGEGATENQHKYSKI